MKISIITVSFNAVATIEDTIKSVLHQDYSDIEYIVIDGASTDGTLEVIKQYQNAISHVISEPDKGIYDAMNKGIKLATGDIIGIINSDDFYVNNNVISLVAKTFKENKVDSIFADLTFVNPDNLNKVVRYYDSSQFHPKKFAYGWMPAHPTFFVKRSCYQQYGLYRTNYKIAADYELLTRFLYRHKISYYYLDKVLIKMRTGGVSTRNLKSNWILNKEIVQACSENGIKTNIFKISFKYFKKIFELIGNK